jgi:GntR family transcriptional regulator, transcriptional repressor for pyruvate dehydrogenase complex
MHLQFEPIVRVRTHEEVVQRIQDQILRGHLKAGDRLPGERELSEQLRVSRPTVREALRVLETLQIIRVPGRTGPDGGAVVEGQPGAVLERLLTLQLALSQYSMGDFVQARCAVEAASAGLAAQVATPEDIKRLEGLLDAMESTDADRATLGELDTRFHTTIGEVCGNPLLAHLMTAIRGAMRHEMLQGFQQVDDWEETRDRLVREHRAILKAIAANDSERANAAVRSHIMDFEPRWAAHHQASVTRDAGDSPLS